MYDEVQFEKDLTAVLDGMKTLLLEKNKAYGNSVFDPVRIFSKADSLEQLNVRIDDKLSRLVRGSEYPGDDTFKDLAGYFIIRMVMQHRKSKNEWNPC